MSGDARGIKIWRMEGAGDDGISDFCCHLLFCNLRVGALVPPAIRLAALPIYAPQQPESTCLCRPRGEWGQMSTDETEMPALDDPWVSPREAFDWAYGHLATVHDK